MTVAHRDLAAGRWWELSLAAQLGNVGSEIGRALRWSPGIRRSPRRPSTAPSS